MTTMAVVGCIRKFWRWHRLWLSLLIPILAAPLPLLGQTSVAKCGYCVVVIGAYWVTEVIPLAVTSLLPVVLFPVFGVMTTKSVCRAYVQFGGAFTHLCVGLMLPTWFLSMWMSNTATTAMMMPIVSAILLCDTLMLFLGSLIVAVAVEKWNLHKRLALRTLTLVGPESRWLLLGLMLPTWFLSMWMSNTATTAMMMPIVSAILLQIKQCQLQDNQEETMIDVNNIQSTGVEGSENNYMDRTKTTAAAAVTTTTTPRLQMTEERVIENRAQKEKKFLGFAKTFSLAVAFSSNIGGVATLTGTPPNVIFKGLADGLYLKLAARNPVDFANWLIVGLPMALVLFVFLWVWMLVYSEGIRCLQFWKKDTTSYEKVRATLRDEYSKMGTMKFPEVLVLVNFIILAILWITRKPGFIPGWGDLFHAGYVGDSTPAIAISVLLFILPARLPTAMWSSNSQSVTISGSGDKEVTYEPLLDWTTVNKRMAWGVLLLMGGGFAMADACEVSGLSAWVSSNLEGLASLPVWATALMLTLIVTAITQVTSNAATTTLFVPIVGDLALKMGINPLYFMIPCTVASSLAFLLPVATPPNAIVFAAGYLKVKDMVLAGLPVNIFAIFILNLAVNTWVANLYDLTNLPDGIANITRLSGNGLSISVLSNGHHNSVNVTALPVNETSN